MRIFRLDKLVKDKVYEAMIAEGQKVTYRILNDDEFALRIREKIVEEALEYQETGDEHELYDLLAAIKTSIGESADSLTFRGNVIQNEFTRRIFVETVTLADEDPWTDYYSANSTRFPEIKEGKIQ